MTVTRSSFGTVVRRLARPVVSALVLAGLAAWAVPAPSVQAAGNASVSLSPSPQVILADGKSITTITASVRDGDGNLVDGASVRFITTLGTLDQDIATTHSGVARVTLTSATSDGTATVSATSFTGTAGGSASGSTHVDFTSDRDALFSSGDAGWIRVECPQYLVYSADDKIIEAQGRKGSVRLRYKSLTLTADALQLDLQSQQVLARNATLVRGRHVVQAIQLRYNLGSLTGTAIVPGDGHVAAKSVTLAAYSLDVAPRQEELSPGQPNEYRFVDISDSRVVISARAMTVSPGDRIQFRRAAIYADGRKILSVPLHVMPISTTQLFGQQLFGVGSQGVSLNIPLYYHVSPNSTGTLFVRRAAQSENDLNPNNALYGFRTRPGFALDLVHTYSFGHGGDGNLSLTSLTRSDWGAHWSHTQRIDEATSGYLFMDYPAHHGFFASSTVSRQFPGFSFNVTATGAQSPSVAGYSSRSSSVNTYVQSAPRPLGETGINMVTSISAQAGQLVQTAPGTGRQVTPISTRSVDVRLFTAPLHPDKHTTLTDALTLGQSWGAGRQSFTMLGTLTLGRSLPGHSGLSLNYTFRYDPLLSQLADQSASVGGLESVYYSSTQQRLAVSFNASPSPRLSLSLEANYGLPLRDTNLYSFINYRVNRDWGLGIASSLDRYAFQSYRETDLVLTRRVFGRDIAFYYSTLTKKIRFDLTSASF